MTSLIRGFYDGGIDLVIEAMIDVVLFFLIFGIILYKIRGKSD